MTENISAETTDRKISISFSRKLSDGNYGGTEATAWVQGEVSADADPSQVSTALANLFTSAKAAVLDELGIAWNIDEEGVVRETVTPFVSAQHAAAAVQRTMGATEAAPQGGAGGVRVMNAGKPEASTDPLPQWLLDECAKFGITAVWDKRGVRQGKQPHFTEAIARGASGHGKDGGAKGFWPPNG